VDSCTSLPPLSHQPDLTQTCQRPNAHICQGPPGPAVLHCILPFPYSHFQRKWAGRPVRVPARPVACYVPISCRRLPRRRLPYRTSVPGRQASELPGRGQTRNECRPGHIFAGCIRVSISSCPQSPPQPGLNDPPRSVFAAKPRAKHIGEGRSLRRDAPALAFRLFLLPQLHRAVPPLLPRRDFSVFRAGLPLDCTPQSDGHRFDLDRVWSVCKRG
jgi:hypothetical protein